MVFSLTHFCPRGHTARRQGRRARNAGPGQIHAVWVAGNSLFPAMAVNPRYP